MGVLDWLTSDSTPRWVHVLTLVIIVILLILVCIDLGILVMKKDSMHPNTMRFATSRDDGYGAAGSADKTTKKDYMELPQFWEPPFAATSKTDAAAEMREGATAAPLSATRKPLVNGQQLVPY